MNLILTRLPLPVRFIALAIYAGLICASTVAVIAARNGGEIAGAPVGHFWITTVVVGVVVGASTSLLSSRSTHSADGAELARYHNAVASGQPSGDVSRWPDWIGRDLKTNRRSLFPVFIWGLVIGVQGIFTGPLWAAVSAFVLAVLGIGLFWYTRRQLQALSEKLTAAGK
ncbi:hypothetical protein [Mycobacterium sp. MMS18-G62]